MRAPASSRSHDQAAGGFQTPLLQQVHGCLRHGKGCFAQCQNPNGALGLDLQMLQATGQGRPWRDGGSRRSVEIDQQLVGGPGGDGQAWSLVKKFTKCY
jgi:hypothetical protein